MLPCPTLCEPHELQYARLPCPSVSPGICSNSCPLSQGCHLNHLVLCHPSSSCPQSFPASELTGVISLQSKGLSRVFSNTKVQKHQSLALSFLYSPTLTSIHDYWKNHSFDETDRCQKVMSLLFNMLSRLIITSLPRSKRLLISWLQSPYAVILEPKKIKSVTVSIVPISIGHEVMGLDAMILGF